MPVHRCRDIPEELMPPESDRVKGNVENSGYRRDLPISKQNRPRTRNDVIERILRYPEFEHEVLAYMSQFQTWEELYQDMEKRESAQSAPRNVTPIRPKRIADGTNRNPKDD